MTGYSLGSYGFIAQEKMQDQPLCLLDLGVERRFEETYFFDNRTRPPYGGYLFQYTLKGRGIYEKKDNRHFLEEGDAFMIKMPEDSRYYLPHEADGCWEFFFLHFDGPAAGPFYEAILEQTGPVLRLSVDLPPIRLFFQLFDSCRRHGALELYEGGEFLYRFLSQLLRYLEAPADGGSPLLRQARSYLKEYSAVISGIGEAAEACHVSQEHLTRCFKRETGQTPLQYLTKLRLENALFLLLNTDDTVDTIARSCGFLNGNYFAKVFRRYLQCSPEEYRKRS